MCAQPPGMAMILTREGARENAMLDLLLVVAQCACIGGYLYGAYLVSAHAARIRFRRTAARQSAEPPDDFDELQLYRYLAKDG